MKRKATISMMVAAFLACSAVSATGEQTAEKEGAERLAAGVAQLRQAVGTWSVTTEFLAEDGSVARSVEGEYHFEWVVPDRVLSGRSTLPAIDRTSAFLFYLNEQAATLEMVSVGADGKLWIMTGPIDEEVRHTQEFETRDGGTSQLRFTRYNVAPDRFESKMEYRVDGEGGTSWKPGNHQVFVRKK